MARAAPSAPALSGAQDACAITKQEDSLGYNEVVQDRRKINKIMTRDVEDMLQNIDCVLMTWRGD